MTLSSNLTRESQDNDELGKSKLEGLLLLQQATVPIPDGVSGTFFISAELL